VRRAVAAGEAGMASPEAPIYGGLDPPSRLFCGVSGLKAHLRRVSLGVWWPSPVRSIRWAPFSTSVADAAALLQVIAGRPIPVMAPCLDVPFPDLHSRPAATVAASAGLGPDSRNASSRTAWLQRCRRRDGRATSCRALGCRAGGCELPRFNDGIATYYVIAPSEASANLGPLRRRKYGYRSEQAHAAWLEGLTARSRTGRVFGGRCNVASLIGTLCPVGAG